MRPQPECPECEKLSAVAEKSNVIGDFIDWLKDKEFIICEYVGDMRFPELTGIYQSNTDLLAEYFEIDLDKVEQERRELLKWLQEAHNG